jgi:hypothetical protein
MIMLFFAFFDSMEFELRALFLLGRHSAIGAMPPISFAFKLFFR